MIVHPYALKTFAIRTLYIVIKSEAFSSQLRLERGPAYFAVHLLV